MCLGVGEECAGLGEGEDGAAGSRSADGLERGGGVGGEAAGLDGPGEDGGEGAKELVVGGGGAGVEEVAEALGGVVGEVGSEGAREAADGVLVTLKGLGAEVFADGEEGFEEVGQGAVGDVCLGVGFGGLGEGGAGGEEGEGGLGVAELGGGEGDGGASVLGVDPRLRGLAIRQAGAASAVGQVDGGIVAASVRGAGDAAVAVAGGASAHGEASSFDWSNLGAGNVGVWPLGVVIRHSLHMTSANGMDIAA